MLENRREIALMVWCLERTDYTVQSLDRISPTRWSLPAKVVRVSDKQLTVHLLGDPVRDIKVPLRHARVLPTDIPRCLADFIVKDIRYAPRARLLDFSAGGVITRDTLMKEANERDEQVSDSDFMP